MQLLLIPFDDSIIFPGMTLTIAADPGDAQRVFVLPRHDGEYATIGLWGPRARDILAATTSDAVDDAALPARQMRVVGVGSAGTAVEAAS